MINSFKSVALPGLLLSAALIQGCAASGSPQNPAAQPKQAQPAAPVSGGARPVAKDGQAVPKGDLVCTNEKVIGSNMPKRICVPRSQRAG